LRLYPILLAPRTIVQHIFLYRNASLSEELFPFEGQFYAFVSLPLFFDALAVFSRELDEFNNQVQASCCGRAPAASPPEADAEPMEDPNPARKASFSFAVLGSTTRPILPTLTGIVVLCWMFHAQTDSDHNATIFHNVNHKVHIIALVLDERSPPTSRPIHNVRLCPPPQISILLHEDQSHSRRYCTASRPCSATSPSPLVACLH
jgi:hypothetical protein